MFYKTFKKKDVFLSRGNVRPTSILEKGQSILIDCPERPINRRIKHLRIYEIDTGDRRIRKRERNEKQLKT